MLFSANTHLNKLLFLVAYSCCFSQGRNQAVLDLHLKNLNIIDNQHMGARNEIFTDHTDWLGASTAVTY